ncbi:amidase [Niveomyces insectorum RCEF 264]|uniref:Amidase n=1 Tax=Niveomyces insectorum RCEF 264 TaxID=1081102 RepID=A0A167YUD1_9HYPO|nr:amidase [Niveomyces insectorum RCEF 264]
MAAAAPAPGQGLSREAFQEVVASLGFKMEPQDEADFYTMFQRQEQLLRIADDLPEYVDPRIGPGSDVAPLSARTYAAPAKKDNPLNAWSHQCEIKDEKAVATGILAGRSVVVKDTISVAGVPLTLGTQPYHLSADAPYPIGDVDATVVTRIIEAGGVLKGTSTCENYCISGLSCTSASGFVQNPWQHGYATGGSSSGSAALLAINAVKAWRQKRGLPVDDLGEGVDFALGGDQGGSIRMPASHCGIYGLKPTHGLVPYTGVSGLHPMIDHVGPMATSVRDIAVLLSAVAGWDGIDCRSNPTTPLRSAAPAYHELLDQAIAERRARGDWTPTTAGRGLRVGVLVEGLAAPVDPSVVAVVRAAAAQFAALGATVVDVSVPLHSKGTVLWMATTRAAGADVFARNKAPDLLSFPLPNLAPPPLSQAWYDTMRVANPMVVSTVLSGAYMDDAKRYPTRHRNKALMHVAQLRAAFDAALDPSTDGGVDVLLYPILPTVAKRHPDLPSMTVLERIQTLLGVSNNTASANVTGHPCLALPGGWAPTADGKAKLPVGIQLMGRHNDDLGVLLAASIWEVGGLGLDKE